MAWLERRIPPPVVALVVAAAMWSVAGAGPRWTLQPAFHFALVAIVAATGIAFDLLGLLAFRRARTTVNPLRPEKASSLVTGGIYRVTRNPMYVGMALVLLAWAAHLSALLPFAGIAAFVAYITRFQIRPEERALDALFGQSFADYAARVRRWL
ncbi:MAG TPA: isoprenylcysteine carboxylmethyltransferase family protein [Burkholderiales bacterium]|jgi:protein-S-isoprenylcysteine O-methyltransferase Ste14|nr:isoprenylcysteine carboxylmethyltransferase family protein [Burkholderiales bacterium]